ncbi:hypothetical protein BASA81_012747 [Batrachochytrium salamandrivorans]|nr:hypothetical protein BASA81_012747 [Batrachochytrium salamandrivorans]
MFLGACTPHKSKLRNSIMGLVLRVVLLLVVLIVVPVVYIHQRFGVNPLSLQPILLTGRLPSARVILPVRDAKKAKLVEQEINRYIADLPNKGSVQVVPGVDFASLETVRQFATKMTGEKIDILVNNAGMMNENVEKTVDGNELVYQVNHLAPLLLTRLLIPNLAPKSRVVFVGSGMQYFSAGVLGDKYSVQVRGLGKETTKGLSRYCDTKLMNTMTAMSFHESGGTQRGGRTTLQGAVTQITVATHPKLTAGGQVLFRSLHQHVVRHRLLFTATEETRQASSRTRRRWISKPEDWLWKTSAN